MRYYIMRVEGVAGLVVNGDDPTGLYLKSADPDAHDGLGGATFTEEMHLAARFSDAAEALAYYQAQSSVRPIREDGKPNKPLTAYHMAVIPVEVL